MELNLGRHKAVHPDRLERWLGKDTVEQVSRDMRGWYGPPIAVHGVPGAVYVGRDGDFAGDLRAGWEATKFDRAHDLVKRVRGAFRTVSQERATLHAGFASLSALIAAATAGGKKLDFQFAKVGPTGVVGCASSLFGLGNWPAAGAASSAAPGGIAPTDATAGAHGFTNPASGELYFTTGYPQANVLNTNYLLYDRIFGVAKTMNSTANESVTGVPSRYQNSTAGTADYAGGNFLFPEVGATVLAATAHNWDTCLYRKADNTDAQTLPTVTGRSAAAVRTMDFAVADVRWFWPLIAGDVGVKDLNQMHCSAAVATGLIDFVIGHPIAFMPCPVAGLVCVADGINTAFNLARIFDDACLALLELPRIATTVTTCNIGVTAVAV